MELEARCSACRKDITLKKRVPVSGAHEGKICTPCHKLGRREWFRVHYTYDRSVSFGQNYSGSGIRDVVALDESDAEQLIYSRAQGGSYTITGVTKVVKL